MLVVNSRSSSRSWVLVNAVRIRLAEGSSPQSVSGEVAVGTGWWSGGLAALGGSGGGSGVELRVPVGKVRG